MAVTSARLWLRILGFTLVAVAILGLIPAVYKMLHDLHLHIEGGEMAIHWVLAAATLAVAFAVRDERTVAMISIIFGVVYLLFGVIGFFVDDFGSYWHFALGDNILHLILGAISLAVGLTTKSQLENGPARPLGATSRRQ